MFSVIVATFDSERALVATLAALVPGATAGVVREVIVTDGGSSDETEQVADIAGCRFVASSGPRGTRLKQAAAMARGEWLMFLPPGVVPGAGWIDEALALLHRGEPKAAVFAAERGGIGAWLRGALGLLPCPEQGLMLRKAFYDELGGHSADAGNPEADLLRRIGRRHLATWRTTVSKADI